MHSRRRHTRTSSNLQNVAEESLREPPGGNASSARTKRTRDEADGTANATSPLDCNKVLPHLPPDTQENLVHENFSAGEPASIASGPSSPHESIRTQLGSHNSMLQRRRATQQAAQNNFQNQDDPASFVPGGSPDQLRNRYKAQLLEAFRDKRAYASAYITLNEKSDKQGHLILRQEQQINAMESSMKRVKRCNGRKRKGNEWSTESLENTPLSDYVGICMSLPLFINKDAFFVVTESVFSTEGSSQVRDWTFSAVRVSKSSAEKAKLFVKFTDGSFGIPTCTMARALTGGFFTNRLSSTANFIGATARKLLASPIGKGMKDEQKKYCSHKLKFHGPTVSKFRKAVRKAVNIRKQSGKNKYLKMLGYELATRSKPKSNPSKKLAIEEEERVARSRTFKIRMDGEPDSMNWRLAPYSVLKNDAIRSSSERYDSGADDDRSTEERSVDILFLNDTARQAFNELRGYSISPTSIEGDRDASALTLARIDAWITTAMKHICVEGKGGLRNNGFVQSFENLVGNALERIITDIWEDIQSLASHELVPCLGDSENEADPYGNNIRDWTVVLRSPDDNYLYLLITPNYFFQHVCSWYGYVKDCQIGRCKIGETAFQKITKSLDFHQHEESDIEGNIQSREDNEKEDELPIEEIPQTSDES